MTSAEVERGLKELHTKKKSKKLLRYRLAFVKKSRAKFLRTKSVFLFSRNQKPLTETELKDNLLKLLRPELESGTAQQPLLTVEEIASDPDLLIYR